MGDAGWLHRGRASGSFSRRLAIVLALERLSSQLRLRPTSDGPAAGTLDDLLRGIGDAAGGADALGGGAQAVRVRGSADFLRLSAVIEKLPSKCTAYASEAMKQALGCHVAGMPWSAEERGRRFIRFGRHEEQARVSCLLSHLLGHILQSKNELALVRVCRGMKAVETSVASGGRSDLLGDRPASRILGRDSCRRG